MRNWRTERTSCTKCLLYVVKDLHNLFIISQPRYIVYLTIGISDVILFLDEFERDVSEER